MDRQRMDVDVVCVGFGPAMAGFLTALSKNLAHPDGTPAVASAAQPGMPLQVLCYERADDIGFGVSGIVTRARGLRATFPDLDPKEIPMATPVLEEKVVYLLDPIGASRRSWALRAADACLRAFQGLLPFEHEAMELPWTPGFLHKEGGLLLSMGRAPRSPRRSSRRTRSRASACSIKAWTSKASPAPASCRAWTSTPRSRWWGTARLAPLAGNSRPTSAGPQATAPATGRWA
jgi:hypothetical protein